MIRLNLKHALLYVTGFAMIALGNKNFFAGIIEERRQKALNEKAAREAKIISSRPFEIQELVPGVNGEGWTNNHHYIQTIHVGRVNFKALRSPRANTSVETHDDENASDTF